MMKIVRAVVGVLIGLGYGWIVGAITLYLLRLTYDPAYPGPMIPDKNGWSSFIAFMVTVVASFCAAVAGMVVGLVRANAIRGAWIAGGIGAGFFLIATVLNVKTYGSWLMREPEKVWPLMLRDVEASFVILPLGLSLVGLLTGFITSKLKS